MALALRAADSTEPLSTAAADAQQAEVKLSAAACTDMADAPLATLQPLSLHPCPCSFLIHWPVVTGCTGPELSPSSAATWAAMEGLVGKGLVRSIGMSNFSRAKLEALLTGGVSIKPAVLQVRDS